MRLAPRDQPVATEATVGPQNDPYRRPRAAELRDNPFNFLQRAHAGIAIGWPQARTQQVLAGKDVTRQIAGVAIVAIKEAAFLRAVHGIIGGIEIKDDLGRRRRRDQHEPVRADRGAQVAGAAAAEKR